jgi:quercetin dioxygenase-like cupin family protein
MNARIPESRSVVVAARWLAIAVAVAAAVMGATLARSQGAGASESQGVSTQPLGTMDLSAEIDGMTGRQMRARLVTIEPGGRIALHSHKDRPTMEYVVQGQPVEIRNGVETPHQPGDMVVASHDVSHSWENRGTTAAVLLPVDIVKP